MEKGRNAVPEEWRVVPGFDDYLVSDLGRVAHIRQLEPNPATGYLSTTLLPSGARRRGSGKRKSIRMFVHRLVLLAFHGPSDMLVRHKDGVRANNRLSNLTYGNHKENAEDAREHGTLAVGSRVGRSKLTEEMVRDILRRYSSEGPTKLATEYGISREHASGIGNGRFWKHMARAGDSAVVSDAHHGKGA